MLNSEKMDAIIQENTEYLYKIDVASYRLEKRMTYIEYQKWARYIIHEQPKIELDQLV